MEHAIKSRCCILLQTTMILIYNRTNTTLLYNSATTIEEKCKKETSEETRRLIQGDAVSFPLRHGFFGCLSQKYQSDNLDHQSQAPRVHETNND